jgi:hypothetical protein
MGKPNPGIEEVISTVFPRQKERRIFTKQKATDFSGFLFYKPGVIPGWSVSY